MRVLVLGSMPGVASLTQQAYYAHPQNAFWPIMAALIDPADPSQVFDFDNATTDFSLRYQKLKQHQIGLWDVLAACERPGSLDSAIKADSIEINDIAGLLARHPECEALVLNGQKAASLFKRHLYRSNPARFSGVSMVELPSTSPAHARLSLQDKITVWRDNLSNFL